MRYLATTPSDVEQMLETIGASSVDELFSDIPKAIRFSGKLDIPAGVPEEQLMTELGSLAARNVDMTRELSFLGAGCYDHYVPAVCAAITSRSEFATSYTPYQPELSQGTLQAIFEYQTAICELTGLEVSNASLYDGATAAAEAMYLAEQFTGRTEVVVARSVSPHVRAVLGTYASSYGMHIRDVEYDPETGATSVEQLRSALSGDVACLIVQQPNFFGVLEDTPALCAAAKEKGAVAVVSADPLSLGVLAAPGSYGADVVVGDGQPLGNEPSFGGPAFGFMAAGERFTRRMPGRIVGQTVDTAGNRAYALTLQTREQHIRREKATSNICTNQSLNALSAIVYLSWLGPAGLRELATLLFDRAAVLTERLSAIDGIEPVFADAVTFREVAFRLPRPAREVISAAKAKGVHPGYALGAAYPDLGDDVLLVAATERRTEADIDRLAGILAEAIA